jgi:hypothetical protein
MASAAGNPAGAASEREVLAFDLYGTLVDPIAISDELGGVLGDSGGHAAARLVTAGALASSTACAPLLMQANDGGIADGPGHLWRIMAASPSSDQSRRWP